MIIYNSNIDLANANEYIKFGPFILKIWSKNQILASIKGHNSVADLRKMTHYNPNIDIVNDNVYTKFGLNLSIYSPDIEQKTIYAGMTKHSQTIFIQSGAIIMNHRRLCSGPTYRYITVDLQMPSKPLGQSVSQKYK